MESKKGTPIFRRIWGLICLLLIGAVAYVLFDASNGAGGLDTNLGSVLFYLCAAFAVLFVAFAVYTVMHWEDGTEAMAVGGTIALAFVAAFLVVWSFFSLSIGNWVWFWGVALASFVSFVNLRTELFWKKENAARGRSFDVSAARNKLVYNKIVCFVILPLIAISAIIDLVDVVPGLVDVFAGKKLALGTVFKALVPVLIVLLTIALAALAFVGLYRGCACGMTTLRFSLLSVLLPTMIIYGLATVDGVMDLIKGKPHILSLAISVVVFVASLLLYVFTSKYYKRNKVVFEN